MTYMNCPRCGLTVQARAHYLIVDRCPRCLARRRKLVQMEPVEATQDPPRPAAEARTRGNEAVVLPLGLRANASDPRAPADFGGRADGRAGQARPARQRGCA